MDATRLYGGENVTLSGHEKKPVVVTPWDRRGSAALHDGGSIHRAHECVRGSLLAHGPPNPIE